MKSARPANLSKTLLRILSYFKGKRILLFLALFTAMLTGLANIFGTLFSGGVTDHILANVQASLPFEEGMKSLLKDIFVIASIYR